MPRTSGAMSASVSIVKSNIWLGFTFAFICFVVWFNLLFFSTLEKRVYISFSGISFYVTCSKGRLFAKIKFSIKNRRKIVH